ncbi:mediator complex subunit 13 carboxy-terminal protein [Rhizoctonia solani AG-3 Rhs1AP]|uniref:Mediator of RNA polymerase II transcription subunit 13 n=1 Tax=Rhizoctonia solani AG-3 Rhs1AP TaxID=1086054 RepID=X8J3X8_9AGAM|nr:mediator complex subunit 13 carboxy-terminal protein [Rhizoctonia solani AG-3 Rhs1AP]
MERARSGSAVPIPALGSTSGVATGPSTPVDAVHPIHTPTAPQPPPQLHPQPQPPAQTQTPTSLANTPIQYVGSMLALNPPLLQQPVVTSPTSDFMDLFGDADFNVPADQDAVFPDLTTTFPELDTWNVPEVQADAKSNDEVRESDFDFFGVADTWGGNAPEMQAQMMDVDPIDLGLDIDSVQTTEQDPTPVPVPVPSPPYFPLTPPQEDDTGWEPLKFGQKYEDVDSKYSRVQGKFGVRGRLVVPQPRPRARTLIQAQERVEEGNNRLARAQSFSWTPTSVLASRIELGLELRPRSTLVLQPHSSPQPPPFVLQARPYPQLQLHHLPQFQLKNQLPTPSPSPNAHRKLRSGYINLTNPSAKRIRTLKLAHSQPVLSTGAAVFARDWVPIAAPQSPTATLSSASDSEADDEDEDEFIPGTAPRSAAPSRGTTPPTSAHPNGASPPGPGLLIALFRPHILGSGMLGDVLVLPTDPKESKTPAPISVPTPVSPGQVVVEAVEAGVNVLAREAVDNWAWGTDQHHIESLPPLPSRNELMLLGSCLAGLGPGTDMSIGKLTAIPKIELPPPGILTDRPYPNSPRLEKLRQPKVSIGHSGQVVQMHAPVLRFWEAAGLEPVGGAKDVVAYAVYEEGEEGGVVRKWMEKVAQVYETRRLGKHAIGETRGGVVAVKWESVAKTLVSFVSSLPQTQSHIVLYLIIPQRALASPALRSFIPTLESNNFISSLSESHHLSTHLVPASLLFDHSTTPTESRQRLEHTALAMYDRIPRTVGRRIRREIIPLDIPAQTTVHVPAYTLARPLAPRFRFSMDWPDAQREALDRHMFLHVAYGFSKSKRWLGATCVDERGEAYETKVWMCEDITVAKVVAKVWSFAMRFAKRAAIEWRVVFCKTGLMELDELEAWEAHTSAKLAGEVRIGMHVSVLQYDPTTGLALSTSASPSVKAPVAPAGIPPSTVIDLTANDYLVLPGYDTEICTIPELESPMADLAPSLLPLATAHYFRLTDPPITRPMGRQADIPSRPDDPPVGVLSSQLHLLHVNLTQNSSLWKSGGDPWRELLLSFYALSVLTQARFPSLDPLPVHLAMLNVILGVSDNRELVPVDLPLEPLS